MESRVRGSEWIIDSSESAQPGAAFGLLDKIATASAAAEGESVQPNSSRGDPVVERGGMEQGLEGGAGLALPEAAGLDPAGRQAGGRGEAGGTDHRGERVLASAHG